MLNRIVVNVIERGIKMGIRSNAAILAAMPDLSAALAILLIDLERGSAMKLPEQPGERTHVLDLHEDMIMIRQDTPGGAWATNSVKSIEQFLLEPMQAFDAVKNMLMFLASGCNNSIRARLLRMRRPVPRVAALLALRNDGSLLLLRELAILVQHAFVVPALAGVGSPSSGFCL